MTTGSRPPSRDEEHFEHIPWEQLSVSAPSWRRWIFAGAAALVVAALTASLVRNSPSGPPTTTSAAATAWVIEPTAATSTSVATSTTVTSYSEADLMALAPASLMAEAAGLAEWIASDYFTADGTGVISSELASVLPVGSSLPAVPEGHRSFVEWSRALSVEEIAPARYRVLVVVRVLGAGAGEDYRRLAPKAVTLDLQWQPEGWSVFDLPAAAAPPTMAQMAAWPSEELPSLIHQGASADGGRVVAGGRVGPNWRVVVEIPDEAGTTWPQVLWFDDAGRRVAPPVG